jgi:hypothetical protein
MFKYAYFVRLRDSRLMPAGQDWGPTLDTYKKGDSLGIKNGKEGIVYAVVKGGMAKQAGADVLIVVEERVPVGGNVANVSDAPGSRSSSAYQSFADSS